MKGRSNGAGEPFWAIVRKLSEGGIRGHAGTQVAGEPGDCGDLVADGERSTGWNRG